MWSLVCLFIALLINFITLFVSVKHHDDAKCMKIAAIIFCIFSVVQLVVGVWVILEIPVISKLPLLHKSCIIYWIFWGCLWIYLVLSLLQGVVLFVSSLLLFSFFNGEEDSINGGCLLAILFGTVFVMYILLLLPIIIIFIILLWL